MHQQDLGDIAGPGPMSRHSWVRVVLGTGFLVWLLLAIQGLALYQGAKTVYVLFSVSSLILLGSGFYRKVSYGYLFLVVFLWLGFWLKFTVHGILDLPYGEPTGTFNGSKQSWDDVLLVGAAANVGVILGWIVYRFAVGTSTISNGEGGTTPAWYPAVRKWLWALMLLCLIGLPAVNSMFGIMQIGLVPNTLLPWPLNAVIGWLVSIGLAMGIATLVWWDMGILKSGFFPVYAILAEAAISTTTLLSRGTFLFHSIPELLALGLNRSELMRNFRQQRLLALLFAAFFALSFVSVDLLRAYLYPDVRYTTTANQIRLTRLEVLQGAIAREEGNQKAGQPVDKALSDLYEEQTRLKQAPATMPEVSQRIVVAEPPVSAAPLVSLSRRIEDMGTRFLQLAVGRWIGLEGVMAVQAYPEKGASTLLKAAKEKREASKTTLYQEVSKSHYRWTDSNVWQFASLPGAAAFFYYSGSMWVVLLGMSLFSAAVLMGEWMIFRVTGNPLLCALIGLALANTVAQFGIAPRQDVPYYFMIACAILIISAVQSKFFASLLQGTRLRTMGRH